MREDHQHKKRISEILVSTLILISICIAANLLSILSQRGAFKFWRSLSVPPSPAIEIINADPFNVWVKTTDGRMYTATTNCSQRNKCDTWVLAEDASEIVPLQTENTVQGPNCEDFDGRFPANPSGKVMECVQTYQPSFPEGGGLSTYFALMSDGTLKYWQLSEGSFLTPFLYLGISNIVCPLIGLLIITGIYPSFLKARANQATNKEKPSLGEK